MKYIIVIILVAAAFIWFSGTDLSLPKNVLGESSISELQMDLSQKEATLKKQLSTPQKNQSEGHLAQEQKLRAEIAALRAKIAEKQRDGSSN